MLPNGVSGLRNLGDQLYAFSNNEIYSLNETFFELTSATGLSAVNDIALMEGSLFIADMEAGLMDEAGNALSPEGPVEDDFSNMRVLNNALYAFHAPSPFTYNGSVQKPSFSVFASGRWEERTIANFTNVSDVASFNGNFYYASIGDGLYDELNNTRIKNIRPSEVDTVVTALASGKELWMSSFGNQHPVHTLNEEGEWNSFTRAQLFDDQFLSIDLSDFGLAWLGSSTGTITVFEPTEGVSDLLSTADGLPSTVRDVEISIEDNAWVATDRGPAFFPSASSVLVSSEALRPTFESRVLFDDQQVNAVVTDGGNRIWFGTDRGLWVFDENTSEQVALFNERNSPLPSNRILDLAYNGSNGEVFVVTDRGMVSYRSNSSNGRARHRNVNVFPNPVRPSYTGLVAITGLARNVTVKITDLNGNLVQELQANGGAASWDLLDLSGSQVATGTYLFFSAAADGEETFVGKLAVIR